MSCGNQINTTIHPPYFPFIIGWFVFFKQLVIVSQKIVKDDLFEEHQF